VAVNPGRRLGRGLDALLGAYGGAAEAEEAPAAASATGGRGRRSLPIEQVVRNPRNPRRDFPPDELAELAASLKQHGMVQPIVVRPAAAGGERYEIIAGERRWRAAQLAGLHDVPVNVLDVTDREALELAIVENVQRSDLNPIEEARGYQALIEEFGHSQAALGDTIGKSRVHVTNTLRLLKLPPAVLAHLERGRLSAGHGRALLSSPDPERHAEAILAKGLSVREAERLAQAEAAKPRAARPRRGGAEKSADIAALERELSDALGLSVALAHRNDGGGELRIAYRTLDQLDAVCRKLRG
jgi:ParB family chromosome partitioning protein